MMQLKLIFIVLATGYFVNGLPMDEHAPYPRFIEFPDGEGNAHQVDLEEEPDMALLQEINRNPADNLYLLFTRRNHHSSQSLVMNNAASIRNSNFNPNNPTVVIVHGWLSNQETDINPLIRDAYLGRSDTNVIVLDWRRLANSGYVTAVSGVPAIGRGLGQFLQFVSEVTGARLDQFHLVGFSLGAHVVGNAGRTLNGRAARVTGLDPAGPLWVYNSDKISAGDAIYVEGIHTDGNYGIGLGLGNNVGHADFYPNGGFNQPGCLTGICDHNRAWRYFAASVTHNNFIGRLCTSSTQIYLNTCRGATFNMGNNDLRKFGRGAYRLDTGRSYPWV